MYQNQQNIEKTNYQQSENQNNNFCQNQNNFQCQNRQQGFRKHHGFFRKIVQNFSEQSGFSQLNQQLIQQGFTKVGQNFKVLAKCGGNLEEAIKILSFKNGKKDLIVKDSGYEQQYLLLKQKIGEERPRKFIKALKMFNGDVEKAYEFLQQKEMNFQQNKEEKHYGRKNYWRNQRNNQGNSNEEENKEEDQQLRKERSQSWKEKHEFKLFGKFGAKIQNALEFFDKKGKNKGKRFRKVISENQDKVKFLFENGFQNPKQIARALMASRFDQEKALQILQGQEKMIKRNEQLADKMIVIMQSGFKKPMKVLKALNKFDGDLQKALEFLQRKENIDKTLKEKYASQYLFLVSKGILKPTKIFEALEECQGDQEKAFKLIQETKEQKKQQFKNEENSKIMVSNLENCQIEKIYVDGNNLLYVEDAIRKILIQQKNKEKAEQVLTDLVRNTAIANKYLQSVLVYDNKNSNKIIDKANNFIVESARPQFKTSDDYLVSACEKENSDKENILFVTSDNGLIKRLGENGAKKVMRSKQFFELMKKTLGSDIYNLMLELAVNENSQQ